MTSTAVKRACDACHRRKVKCDGVNPCRNCATAQLGCTYNAIPQKKGPKGSRAKVISELRETQRQTTLSAKVQNRFNGIISPPPSSPTLAPTPGLLTPEMVKDCLDFFFVNLYPTMPILNRQRLDQQVMYMDQRQDFDTYCLLTALCAFVLLQPGMGIPGGDPYMLDAMPGSNIISSTHLRDETIKVRKGYDYLEKPTLNALCTSYFLFGCYYGVDMHDKAWFHLREATTLAHIGRMHEEDTYRQLKTEDSYRPFDTVEAFDAVEASFRRRVYWLLFVTERTYAVQRRRPLTLQASIELPNVSDDPTDPLSHHLNGFILLVNLFRPFDDGFMALWNKSCSKWSPICLSGLQKQLSEVLPPYLNSADTEQLRDSQQWLKTMTWQMRTSNGHLSSNGDDMSYQYSGNMTNSVLPTTSSVPQQSLELLRTPWLPKLYDISCALIDVLALQPASRDPFSPGPREQLHPLLNILSVLRTGDHRFLPLLLTKVNEVLPKLASPMLQNAPDNALHQMVDIFDGFGNAGMAQPPIIMDEYEKKYVPIVDDLGTDSGSSHGGAPPSSNDMTSPYISSPPPVMSPGTGYSHALPESHFNPIHQMADIVMDNGVPPSNPPHTPHAPHSQHGQHQQHTMQSLTAHVHNGMSSAMNQPPNMNMDHHTQGLSHSFNGGLGQGMPYSLNQNQNLNASNIMMNRQAPPRADSFAMSGAPPIRTVGDFHALQRANSDIGPINTMGMNNGLGPGMDFNTLRQSHGHGQGGQFETCMTPT